MTVTNGLSLKPSVKRNFLCVTLRNIRFAAREEGSTLLHAKSFFPPNKAIFLIMFLMNPLDGVAVIQRSAHLLSL